MFAAMRWQLCVAMGFATSAMAESKFGTGADVNHVTSPHFDAVGNVPVARLELEVRRFEQLFDVFTTFFQGEPMPAQRLRLIVMKSGEPAEFAGEFILGFVTRHNLEPLLVSAVDEKSRSFSVNTHELVHLVSRYALPYQPRWFSEGIASFFEDAHFDRDGSIKMGLWADPYDWASLDELLRWGERSIPVEEQPRLYGTARALLFYLANRDEPRLRLLIEGLRSRQALGELYAAAFPSGEREALMQRAKDFVAERRFSAWRTSLTRTADVTTLPKLEPWQVEVIRARIFEACGSRADSLVALRAAQAVAPTPMPAELAAEFLWRDWPAPIDHSSPAVQLALADAIDRSYAEVLEAAGKATQAMPTSAFAWYLLSRARSQVRDHQGALDAADRAAALAPQSSEILFRRARALINLSRCAEARTAVSVGIGVIESPSESTINSWEQSLKECK